MATAANDESAHSSVLKSKDLASDINNAVESPFVANPAQAATVNVPVEYMRRIEEAQRNYSKHHLELRVCEHAQSWAATTIGIQFFWIGVGTWVLSRGLRYSDPLNSVISKWVESKRVRRFTTPVSCLGWFIILFTCSQLPYDLNVFSATRESVATERREMDAALKMKAEALLKGHEAMENERKKEEETFAKSMSA